jgi:acyl carrier protein
MDRNELLLKLSDTLQVNADEINEDFALDSEIWDSLAILSAIAAIDEVCGITVPAKELKACLKVGDVFALVEKQLAH